MRQRAFISLLMPTRGRRALAERFLKSVVMTATYADSVEVVFYADDDDPESHDLRAEGISVTAIVGPRLTMGEYNSRCLQKARGDVIILVNDDVVVRTQGWDEKVRELDAAFPDKIYLAYGNDLFKGSKLCTFPILSRRTCELLVDPFPAAYAGAFIDYHLLDIFKRIQRFGESRIRYCPDIIFEHMHYRTGKGVKDSTYARRDRFRDDSVFLGFIGVRSKAARRLASAIHGEKPEEFVPLEVLPASRVSLLRAAGSLTRGFLFDRELPLRWRSFLWYWYVGRLLAARGLLWPFVK